MKPISIIVISYNRAADALALLHNLVQLQDAAELVEELILVNNASSESYIEIERFTAQPQSFPIRYLNPGTNLGVAAGRNFAIRQSKAPILLMLDDDAILQNSDALVRLAQIFESNKGKMLGALACKVLYYETQAFQINAFPHKDFEARKNLASFDTYYFTGCAHALNRKALDATGLYPEDFFYGMEEYDLGYRLLQAGYRIAYNSGVVLLHKESPHGRVAKAEKLQMMWVNKTKVAWRYLSLLQFTSTAFMWSIFFLKKSGFNLPYFLKGWKAVAAIPKNEQRTPLNAAAKAYLQSVNARLWY
jgi:GT2 family glycosyltransferase